jgi:hypothetical protein
MFAQVIVGLVDRLEMFHERRGAVSKGETKAVEVCIATV